MLPASRDSISDLSMVLFVSFMLTSELSDPRSSATSLMLDSFACLGLFYHVRSVYNFSFSDNTKHISMKGSKQYQIICKCGKHDTECNNSIGKPPTVIYSVLYCVTGPPVDLNLEVEFLTCLTGIKHTVNLEGLAAFEGYFSTIQSRIRKFVW